MVAGFSRAQWYLCLRFAAHLAMYRARLEARWSRTPYCRQYFRYAVNGRSALKSTMEAQSEILTNALTCDT